MADRTLTSLGALLERARTEVLRISAREAARRAGLSDARWRQVVTGVQTKAGATVPVRPSARTVVAMALAVRVDPVAALPLAGYDGVSPASVAEMVAERIRPAEPDLGGDLAAEVMRIQGLPFSAANRLALVRALVDLHVQAAAEGEQQAG